MTNIQKAQSSLNVLKKITLEVIKNNPDGVGNSVIAKKLNLESDFEGKSKNYLTYAILGIMINEKTIKRKKNWK